MDHQDHSSHHSRVRIYRDNRAFSNMYHSMNSPFEEVPVGYTQVVVAAGNSPVVVVPVGNNLVVVEDLVDSSPVEGLVGYTTYVLVSSSSSSPSTTTAKINNSWKNNMCTASCCAYSRVNDVDTKTNLHIGSFKIENLLLIVTKCVTKRQTATQ